MLLWRNQVGGRSSVARSTNQARECGATWRGQCQHIYMANGSWTGSQWLYQSMLQNLFVSTEQGGRWMKHLHLIWDLPLHTITWAGASLWRYSAEPRRNTSKNPYCSSAIFIVQSRDLQATDSFGAQWYCPREGGRIFPLQLQEQESRRCSGRWHTTRVVSGAPDGGRFLGLWVFPQSFLAQCSHVRTGWMCKDWANDNGMGGVELESRKTIWAG